MISRTHSDDRPSKSVNFKVDLLCEECVMTVAACLVGAAPPLWVNGKLDSMNSRKGCTAVVRALRPELLVVLAVMQVNESHPLSSSVLTPVQR